MLRLKSSAAETVMIGDNLGVDIKAGIAAGTHTLLVFSGKDTPESLAKSSIQPEYVYTDLAALLQEFTAQEIQNR
ncbi:MAG: HAD hydrolase-like protein [Ktedonobacteraceae bacterium]|nr:HAD hydrolase-like protein [Ktedonobacteraceae bacterium]